MSTLLDEHISERDFQDLVIQFAKLHGWRVHAERPGRTKDGWRTAIQGDPGWPDLVMLRDARLLVVELKRQKGKLTKGQEDWLRAFANASVSWRVWRPSDWESIQKELE